MRVKSIWTAVEPGYPTRDCFLGLAVEMAMGKMNGVTELHNLAKKIGPMAEAFENAGHKLAARLGAPLVVHLCNLVRRVTILDKLDLGFLVRHWRNTSPRELASNIA